jgi:splicing factor U2AF subunit
MYSNPPVAIAIAEGNKVSDEALKEAIKHFEDFFEEVFLELAKYGELQDMNVCDNLGDHLIGNVYVKFSKPEDAEAALKAMNGRYYSGKPIIGEYSPVTDFRECRCRQYEDGSCGRGGYCNFMHLKYISKSFKKSLFEQMFAEYPQYKDKRDRSRDRKKKRTPSEESDCIYIYNLVADRTSEERRDIIERWNKKFEKEKEEERRKREAAEAKINFILQQQKLQEKLNKLNENKV